MIWVLLALQLSTQPSEPRVFPPDEPMGSTNASAVIGEPRGERLAGNALESETNRISALLRCPVCQGLSVADSPSAMATNMKRQVRELLSWGYTEPQILAYFESSYGEFVRLQPPVRGINWLVWLGPVLALLGGIGFILYIIRRAPDAPAEERAAEPELDSYLARARELTSTDAGTRD